MATTAGKGIGPIREDKESLFEGTFQEPLGKSNLNNELTSPRTRTSNGVADRKSEVMKENTMAMLQDMPEMQSSKSSEEALRTAGENGESAHEDIEQVYVCPRVRR